MILFILNGSSGTGQSTDNDLRTIIEARVSAAGRLVRIVDASGEAELVRAAKDGIAAGAQAIVAGGGDGTISTVAGVLAESDVSLGVLPLGTLNHFAKDLGIPLKLEEALDVILAGHTMQVDAGEVNTRLFLNNSSLGLYARIVRLRQRYPARGIAKWFVAGWAMLKVMERNPVFTVSIGANGERRSYRTTLVLVGNNAYRMAGLDAGSRETVTGGTLAVYVVRSEGKLRLVRLMWHIVSGKAEESDELEVHQVSEATVETGTARTPVAMDGEVEEMEMPLTFRARAGVLRVLVPQGTADTRPAS